MQHMHAVTPHAITALNVMVFKLVGIECYCLEITNIFEQLLYPLFTPMRTPGLGPNDCKA